MTQRQEHTDLLVIGGGTAGFGAAVAAGRLGLDVTLVEASSKIGGVMAFCPGMPWGGGYPNDRIIGGLIEELSSRLAALDPPAAEKRPCTLENFGPEILYDPDIASLTMFDMLAEAGVRLRLNTTAFAPLMQPGAEGPSDQRQRIAALDCFDRHGPLRIAAKMVIDCSGDGDIAANAGVAFALGDATDASKPGAMMAVTMSFFMVNVDWQAAFADPDPYFTAYAQAGVAEGLLHPDLAQLYLMKGFHPGSVFCNSVHIRGVDGTDPQAVADATQEGRKRCHALARFLRARVPGFEQAHMTLLSPTVGVRETRKLQGVYRLTGHDLASGTKFADGIVACDNPIDDVMRAEGDMTHHAALAKGDYYSIPFRALIPQRIANLMFAGRILSADPVAFASVRGMPQCMAMGQATGTAAALALEAGLAVQDLPVEPLIASLRAQGLNRIGARGDSER
jgi:choline dehydrogenase-like flavoprotein